MRHASRDMKRRIRLRTGRWMAPWCRVGENRRVLSENSSKTLPKSCLRPTRACRQDLVSCCRKQTGLKGKTVQTHCPDHVSGLPGCRVGENRRFLKENSPRPPQKTCFRPTRAGQQDRVSGSRKQTVFEGKQPKTTAEIMFRPTRAGQQDRDSGSRKQTGFQGETVQKQ